MNGNENQLSDWQKKLHEVIYEADTPAGKLFDVSLIIFILLSVAVVMLESVKGINDQIGTALYISEWTFTVFFTIEYILRVVCIK